MHNGPRRIAESANILGQDYGDEPRIGIGEHAHCVADPVVTRKGFGRPRVLVDEDRDSVLVVQFDRCSIPPGFADRNCGNLWMSRWALPDGGSGVKSKGASCAKGAKKAFWAKVR